MPTPKCSVSGWRSRRTALGHRGIAWCAATNRISFKRLALHHRGIMAWYVSTKGIGFPKFSVQNVLSDKRAPLVCGSSSSRRRSFQALSLLRAHSACRISASNPNVSEIVWHSRVSQLHDLIYVAKASLHHEVPQRKCPPEKTRLLQAFGSIAAVGLVQYPPGPARRGAM